MKLPQDTIDELKKIYHEEYGRPLSEADAQEMGQRLLRLFKIIYRPIPSGELSCKCRPVDRFPAPDRMK